MLLARDQKLTQDGTKLHHRRLVLKAIYNGATLSRADIARLTGLTRTTASSVVAELIEDGLVTELGQGPPAGGKPPTLLQVVDAARQVIGIDVARATVQGGLFDLRGRVLHRVSAPATSGNGRPDLAQITGLIDDLVAAADRPLVGIGAALPGLIDPSSGVIHQTGLQGWQEFSLGGELRQRYGLPIHMVNDSQAAALAEYTFAGHAAHSLAVVLLKRGVSAGIVLDGQVYHGASYGGASEIGHVRAVEGGELCSCGHFGCLETVASERALVRWAQTLYRNDAGSRLLTLAPSAAVVDFAAVLQAFQAGDPGLEQVVGQVARYLGAAVASLVAVLNVPLVVLAGRLARLGEPFTNAIAAEMRQRLLAPLAERVEVKVSMLGDDIIMSGAAALLLSSELGVV